MTSASKAFSLTLPLEYQGQIKMGSKGNQCIAVKRALARAGFGDLYAKGTKTPLFGPYAVKNTKHFQAAHGIDQTGVVGPVTFEKLAPFFDAYSKSLYMVPKDEALATARQMVQFGMLFHTGYQWGGEHDSTLQDDTPNDWFDCSSSVSFMLWHFGLMPIDHAEVSTWFEGYGVSGAGKYVTIFANWEHVWIRFDLPEGYYRFDTSPHGDGTRGPRIRTRRRSESNFHVRHPKGL